MAKKGDQLWQKLRIGDRVRLVEYPPEFRQTGYHLHPDTVRVYMQILARKRSVRIYEVDDFGLPWVRVILRARNGELHYHHLAFNHGGFVRVRNRRGTAPRRN